MNSSPGLSQSWNLLSAEGKLAAKPEILCLGHDIVLNRTRRMILQKCCSVTIAGDASEAVALLAARHFDLLLLCYSLTDDECSAIVAAVATLPRKTKILALAPGSTRLDLAPPHLEFVSDGPSELLRKVAAMTDVPLARLEDCDRAGEIGFTQQD